MTDGEVTLPGDVIDKECPSCTSVVASCHRPEGMTGASNNQGLFLLPIEPCFLLNHDIKPGHAGCFLQSRASSAEQLCRSRGSWVCMWPECPELYVGSRHQETLTSLSPPRPPRCTMLFPPFFPGKAQDRSSLDSCKGPRFHCVVTHMTFFTPCSTEDWVSVHLTFSMNWLFFSIFSPVIPTALSLLVFYT